MKLAFPFQIGIAALVLSTFSGCGSRVEAGEVLILTGSSTVAPLVGELGQRFEQDHPGTHIDVQSGGSSRGIADVRLGHAGVGMTSRSLDSTEADLTAHTIARDGVALIVHQDNPIAALSTDQVRGIFNGTISDWSEVGGDGGKIIVVNKAEGRATLTVFLEHFGLTTREVQADVIVGENEQAIKTIAGAPNAVAYVSIGTAQVDIQAGIPIQLVRLDGVEATAQSVASGQYTLARPLNLVTTDQASELALEFIAFARHADQRDLIQAEAFVPVDGK